MQKHSEVPDRNRGDACEKKKKEQSRGKKESRSPSAVTGKMTTLKSFLLLMEEPYVSVFPLVATVSFTNNPRLKTPYNGFIKITIKTPYNGLNDYT